MDTINEFLKNQIPKDFGLTDNKAIEYLKECMEELREYGLDINTKQIIPSIELPTTPFGHVDKITRERIINNQKKQSMDQIVEKFKSQNPPPPPPTTINKQKNNSTLSIKSDDSSGDYDLNPSRLSDYDKESILSDLTDSRHSSQTYDDFYMKRCPSDYDNLDQKFDNTTLKNTAVPSPKQIIKIQQQSPLRTTVAVNFNYKKSNNEQLNGRQSDVYELKLESELDREENINIKKNITRIVYDNKGKSECIRYPKGIYQPVKSNSQQSPSVNYYPAAAASNYIDNNSNVKILTKISGKNNNNGQNGYDYI
jgi:hypothetical protein